MDFHQMIEPLSNPAAGGGAAADAFDLVIPSLPGFGFSSPFSPAGLTVPRLADLLHDLMTRVLGYRRFAVAGGDWGAIVSLQIAHAHPDDVAGVFTTIPVYPDLNYAEIPPDKYAPDEQWMLERQADAQPLKISHLTVQNTDPQTLAYALVDSPAGTAAWLWERRRSWSDCGGDLLTAFDRDFLCTLASIYWLTGTIGSSLRIYWDNYHAPASRLAHGRAPVVEVPSGFAIHPKEVVLVPRAVAAAGTNLHRWTIMPKGGHFGFAEQPTALTTELREFFRPLRGATEVERPRSGPPAADSG
jgi:pimeloyl-ACP methyl ester carboxylesterase